MSNIAAAFVKAQRGFAPALKEKNNPAFKGSKYADLGACIDAVIESLHANGIALIQRTLPDDSGVTVTTVFLHESGEQFDGGALHVPAAKNDPQGYGSALTYARRYSLMAACGIAPEDDDGNAATKAKYAADDSLVPVLEASIEQEKQKRQGVMAAVLPSVEAYLDAKTKTALAKLAFEVGEAFKHPKEGAGLAYDRIEIEELNSDEKLYLWSMLDSKIRSALKRERETRSLSKETA
jgi:hypothetical protein